MSATRVPWYVPRGHTGLSEHGDPRVAALLEPSVLRYQSNGEGGLQRCAGAGGGVNMGLQSAGVAVITLAIIINRVQRMGQILRHGEKVLQIVW